MMSSPAGDNDAFTQLTSMGFAPDQAQEALSSCNGNVERALDVLLSGGGTTTIDSGSSSAFRASESSPSTMIQCSSSQYSFPEGRSACTCISLVGASLFLQSKEKAVTPELLETMLLQGVNVYQRLQSQGTSSVEHLSADEVLQQKVDELSCLSLQGSVRQGILSDDEHHPLGMRALLEGLEHENTTDQWTAVVITKPPETVVVCLPPQNINETSVSFILLDSHPRPSENFTGAHAQMYSSLNDLVQAILTIFPTTNLGPDIPEMMAMMYNSFDLYPLVLDDETT